MIFGLGVVAGSLATTLFFEKRLEAMTDDEFDAWLENDEEDKKVIKEAATEVKKAMVDYSAIIDEYDAEANRPYTISPDDLGDTGYDIEECTMYSDGVMTYDGSDVMVDIDDVIGTDNLSKVGEYDDDYLYIRNEERETDYKIEFLKEPYLDEELVDDS